MRTIAVINKAKTKWCDDFSVVVQAMQVQLTRDAGPRWNESVTLSIIDGSTDDYETCVVLDNADQAQALGYHDESPKGNPIGKVFVLPTQKEGDAVSTVLSHELIEMLTNPHVNKIAKNPRNGYTYPLEGCDAVQAETYLIDGVLVSNFITPAWFDPAAPASAKFDYLGNVHAPFQINKGGYSPVQLPNGQWTQIFASLEAQEKYWRLALAGTKIRTSRIREELEVLATGAMRSTRTDPKHIFDPKAYPLEFAWPQGVQVP